MKKILLILAVINISSCSLIPTMPKIPDISESLSDFSNYISPTSYGKDINQGSILRKEKFDLVKNGMTKNQVKSLIGSPSVVDIFHANQWEFIHHSYIKNEQVLSFRVTLIFNNEILEKIQTSKIENISKVQDYDFSEQNIKEKKENSDSQEDSWYKFW